MSNINREAIIRCIKIRKAWHSDYTIEEVIEDIEAAPDVDEYDKPITGEWIAVEKPRLGNPYRHYKCSHCGNPVPYIVNFCENCGSRNTRQYTKEDVISREAQ